MDPIYDRQGRVVGWQRDANLYHLDGSHAGVVNRDNVYGQSQRRATP